MNLSEKAFMRLKDAGWYPGRKIDITKYIYELEEEGFVVFNKAKDFLQEFGGLGIKYKKSTGIEEYHVIIPSYGVGSEGRDPQFDEAFNVERWANERVVPVGVIYRQNMNLYITESGRFSSGPAVLGNNFEEVWECLLGDKMGTTW